MKLFKYEAKKILIKQYGLFIFAAVILIKLISLPEQLNANYGFKTSADRNTYLEMLKPLSGILTEENEEKIINMKERLLEAQSLDSQCFEALRNGDLETYEEINKRLLDEYMDVLENKNAIERIFEQYSYASEEREVRALIPVKKVGVMENASVNYLFLLCICFCCAYAIMVEQGGKAEVIIRTTPNGQGKTMAAKFGVLFVIISISALALSVIDLTALSAQLPSEYWQYNVGSLEGFKNCPVKISIMGVFVIVQLMRLLGALFIGAAAMLTAHFSHNYAASIFPFAAIPIVADYVSDRDSQSYFLPTGLLKGWGYFYGDVAERGTYDEHIFFHNIPMGYTLALTAFSLMFVIGAAMLLIRSGKNRLAHKGGRAVKIAALGVVLMLLSSCSAKRADVVEEYGGSISIYRDNNETGRYKFEAEPFTVINEHGWEGSALTLKITDKETGKTEEYPFDPFEEELWMGTSTLFACEDCLLFIRYGAVMRLDLDDFSLTTVYARKGLKKVVFGLVFDFGENEIYFDPDGAFTDGKTIFIYKRSSGIAKLELDGSLSFLVSDEINGGLEYDGKTFYYISKDNLLHKYDIASGKNTVIYEGEVTPDSLSADREKVYFQSYGTEVVLDKADLK